MPSGLVALLDDIAAITKLAAASLDDVAGAAGKAGAKAAGVVVDDTAVTPRYVMGFAPERELPIIWKIAVGSMRNKILFILPAALLLSAFAPWAVTPLLMIGGTYLCFEAAEKIIEAVKGEHPAEEQFAGPVDPAEVERTQVSGAIRTDFILSAEIMAIALADVAGMRLLNQALVLLVVAVAITLGVYGVVALIVKTDDIGLHLAQRSVSAVRMVGRGLVKGMPVLLRILATVGTAAMLWVGGGIVVHGLETFHLEAIPHFIHHAAEVAGHAVPAASGLVEWTVGAIGAGVFGLVLGAIVALAIHPLLHRKGAAAH